MYSNINTCRVLIMLVMCVLLVMYLSEYKLFYVCLYVCACVCVCNHFFVDLGINLMIFLEVEKTCRKYSCFNKSLHNVHNLSQAGIS